MTAAAEEWMGFRPRIRRGARLSYDKVRSAPVVLHPEGVLILNPTAAAVLELCDGERSLSEIAELLADRYDAVRPEQIRSLLDRLADKQVVGWA